MSLFVEFLMGRSNRLLRDMLVACALVAAVSLAAMTYINQLVDTFQTAQQAVPPRPQAARSPTANEGRITTITRSVLDDPIATGSVTTRKPQ